MTRNDLKKEKPKDGEMEVLYHTKASCIRVAYCFLPYYLYIVRQMKKPKPCTHRTFENTRVFSNSFVFSNVRRV